MSFADQHIDLQISDRAAATYESGQMLFGQGVFSLLDAGLAWCDDGAVASWRAHRRRQIEHGETELFARHVDLDG